MKRASSSKRLTREERARLTQSKIARLRGGARPRVLDLFAGCGGMSLGFLAAGFEIVAAVENDADAARSHSLNFHSGNSEHAKPRDITKTGPAELFTALGLGHPAHAVDVVVGGPPCQAFARIGRSKLREVADHPEAFRHDPRARLYIEYVHYVDECAPLAVVMENVPDMLNFGGHNLAEEIAEVLEERGYVCRYTLLNAAYYGVPQMRERMFLIAIRNELVADISFPAPTNWVALPQGYEGSRSCALKLVAERGLFDPENHYRMAPSAAKSLPPAVTTRQAIQDLPFIDARRELKRGTLRRGTRRFLQEIEYRADVEPNAYATFIRDWVRPGTKPKDHVIRYLPRDYPLFAKLKPGDEYPEAHRCALSMLQDAVDSWEKDNGCSLDRRSSQYRALKKKIVPPYDPGKFPNKWRKMEADLPARTLLAHLGKDGYSHIHYDSDQARTISVREAARLQSFPDWFVFSGTMNPAFRQIGNAVPPLLGFAVASAVRQQMAAGAAAEAIAS